MDTYKPSLVISYSGTGSPECIEQSCGVISYPQLDSCVTECPRDTPLPSQIWGDAVGSKLFISSTILIYHFLYCLDHISHSYFKSLSGRCNLSILYGFFVVFFLLGFGYLVLCYGMPCNFLLNIMETLKDIVLQRVNFFLAFRKKKKNLVDHLILSRLDRKLCYLLSISVFPE